MALTDVAIRKAKPGAKAIKLADGGGNSSIDDREGRKQIVTPRHELRTQFVFARAAGCAGA